MRFPFAPFKLAAVSLLAITAAFATPTHLSIQEGGTSGTTPATARAGIGAAESGANSSITSLTGLSTPLSLLQGGVGSNTAAGARTNLGAAASGTNGDITSLTALTSISNPLFIGGQLTSGASSFGTMGEDSNLSYGVSYSGYNVVKSGANWVFGSDGANNAGTLAVQSIYGGITYYVAPVANGTTAQTLTSTQLSAFARFGVDQTGAHVYPTTASTSTSTGALTVNGGAGIAGAVNIGGTSSITGAASFGSAVTLSSSAGGTVLTVGNSSATSTTPTSISMDTSFSSVPGQHPKISLYGGAYGLGVSSGQLDIISGGTFGFFSGATLVGSINSAGLFSIPSAAISGAMSVGTTLNVTGTTSLTGGLYVTGATAIGNAAVGGNLTVAGNAVLSGQTYIPTGAGSFFGFNLHYASGWVYSTSDYGYEIRNDGADISINGAPSGTAGGTAAPTTLLTINQSGLVNVPGTFSTNGMATLANGTVTGKLGVGTSTPADLAHLFGNTTSSLGLVVTNAGTNVGSQARVALYTGTTNSYAVTYVADGANPYFATSVGSAIKNVYWQMPNYNFQSASGTPWMTIDNTGAATFGSAVTISGALTVTLGINGNQLAPGAAAINGALAHVPNAAALIAFSPYIVTSVYRDGVNTIGDGGAGFYKYNAANCATLSLPNDNGGCLNSSVASGSWVLNLPSNGVDPRVWGLWTTDATAVYQAAVTAICALTPSGGKIAQPSQTITFAGSTSLSWSCPIWFDGSSPNEISTGGGTWWSITGVSANLVSLTSPGARGTQFTNIGITETQPTSFGPGWAPTVYPPVFSIIGVAGRIRFDNIHMSPVYDLISAQGAGRLDIGRLYGQPLHNAITADTSYDVDHFNGPFHFWDFWSSNQYVLAWQVANADVMILGRVDGLVAPDYFAFGYHSCLKLNQGSAGGVGNYASKIHFGSFYCDASEYGIWSTTASGQPDYQRPQVIIDTFAHTGLSPSAGTNTPMTGSASIQVDPSGGLELSITHFRSEDTAQPINLSNTAVPVVVKVMDFHAAGYSGTYAIASAATNSNAANANEVDIATRPVLEGVAGGDLCCLVTPTAPFKNFRAPLLPSPIDVIATTGGTLAIPSNAECPTFNSSGTITGNFTVTLPAAPFDGQLCKMIFHIAASAFFISNTGGVGGFDAGPASVPAYGTVTYQYRANSNYWFRMP